MLALLVAACSAKPVPRQPSAEAAPPPVLSRQTEAVLVAGDASIPAFENAVDYLRDALLKGGLPPGQIHRLSAHANPASGMAKARIANIVGTIAALRPASDSSCLIFLTSHGSENHGFYLQDDDALMPATLDGAMTAGCGAVPTVLVVSACYSGQFVAMPLRRANRIIITAARSDRSSFGCEAGATFTFFDECLLGSLPGAGDWRVVVERTRGCVGVRERQIDALPSEPQAFFGADVESLALPNALSGLGNAAFEPSGDNFSPGQIPLQQSDRRRLAKDLKAFAKAEDPKAMALVPNGLAVWTDRTAAGTNDLGAVSMLALQRCEFLSGGACVLYAENKATVRLLPSGLPPFHPMVLVRQGRLQVDAIPFVPAGHRQPFDDYQSHDGPKALAIDPTGGGFGVGFGTTLAAARDDALARCESAGNDCIIYAEGEEVVLGWRG